MMVGAVLSNVATELGDLNFRFEDRRPCRESFEQRIQNFSLRWLKTVNHARNGSLVISTAKVD